MCKCDHGVATARCSTAMCHISGCASSMTHHSIDKDLQCAPPLLDEVCCHLKLLYCTLFWQRGHNDPCVALPVCFETETPDCLAQMHKLHASGEGVCRCMQRVAHLCWYLEPAARAMQSL